MRLCAAALILLTFALGTAEAQRVPTDTLILRRVGPGMTYVRIVAPSVPWSIDVLELDRNNPYLEIEMVEGNDRRAGGLETVSSMASRREGPEHHVVGAINGDFFLGGGETVNAGVAGGQVVRRSAYAPARQPSFGFSVSNAGAVTLPSVGGTLLTSSDTLTITGYNEPRAANALVLYNSFGGATTGTDSNGTEVVIRPTTGWVVNDTVEAVVERVTVGVGREVIPAGWAVLSGRGRVEAALQALVVGARVRVVATVAPGLPRLEDLISGRPILILGGQPYPIPNDAHNTDRHPRTAVGVNADTSRIYFVTVDGRQPSSAGMTNVEMRDFMMDLGITDAIGLDGGGSTTMVIRGQIANSPSGSERPVGNGLLAVSTAPIGPMVHLQADPSMSSLFLGESVRISASGSDAFYNPIEINASALAYRVDAALGTVTQDGVFTAAPNRAEPDTGYVFVNYGMLTDSVRVAFRVVSQIAVEPGTAVTDTLMTIPFKVRATDSSGLTQTVPDGRVTWQVLDSRVGSISPEGVFAGRVAGATRVVATYSASIRDTSYVEVQVGRGEMTLDPLDDPADWQVVSEGLDEVSFSAVDDPNATGGRALRLHYRFTRGDRPPSLQVRTRIPIFGVPDSLRMRVRTDGRRHILRYLLENPFAAPLSLSVPRYADATEFTWMPGPLARAVPAADLSYPVVVTGIEVLPALTGVSVGEQTEGTLVFDDLRVSYPSGSVGTDTAVLPEGLGGPIRVFPNPSRETATVAFTAPSAGVARVDLYDALGRLVLTLFNEQVAPGDLTVSAQVGRLPVGTYLVRATVDGRPIGAAVPLVVTR